VVYSKFFNLVRKYRKFKKVKIGVFRSKKQFKYNKLKTNGKNTVCKNAMFYLNGIVQQYIVI